MKKLIFILLIFVAFRAGAQTYSITGRVSDEKGPLPGATVFLANTKIATATDGSGKFALSDLQPGVYQLVVKMIGFDEYDLPVILQKNYPELHIVLKGNSIMLKTVNISGISSGERKEYLDLFKQYFIGQSDNASNCKLLNPEVIDFSYNKKTNVLEASSEKFIIIENKALGYNVHYLLKAFNFNKSINLLYYEGSSYLEELQGTASQKQKWDKNRQLTYEGSEWHFFKAAFNNTLEDEGFLIYRFPTPAALKRNGGLQATQRKHPEYFIPFKGIDSLFVKVDENIKQFNLKLLLKDSTLLYVTYLKKEEPDDYIRLGKHIIDPGMERNRYRQTSVIRPLLDSVLIDRNGNINPKNGIARAGYWTWNMAAGFLPPDYLIPAIKKQ